MAKNFSSRLVLILLVLFVLIFTFFLYTFLHESGHALTGMLFGQKLTEINIDFFTLSAHVGLAGGTLTPLQQAVESAAGAGLPLLLWVVFIVAVPRKGNFTLEVLKLIASMAVVNTLLTWIVLPLLFISGNAPADDVTSFLLASQMPPLLLAFIALVLYGFGWLLFLSKIDGLSHQLHLFRESSHEQITAGTRTSLPVMAGLMAVCAILVVVVNATGDKSLAKTTPPQGFDLVAQIDLSQRAYPSEPVWQFTLDQPAYVGVFIVIRDINTSFFDLSVTGPSGFQSTVMHGEGYQAYQDGGLWEQRLPAGTYQLVLASHASPGSVQAYLRIQ